MDRLKWRQSLGLFILVAVALVVGGILLSLYRQPPKTIDTALDESLIHLQASRATTFFPNDCVVLSWEVEHIKAIYINGMGTVGVSEQKYCGSTATFTIVLPDNTEHVFTLEMEAWFTRSRNRVLLFVLSCLAVVGLALIGWLPGYYRFKRDTKLLWNDVKASIRCLRHESWTHFFLLMLILAAGFCVRLYLLPHEIDIDEAESFNHYVVVPLFDGIANYNDTNNHLLNTALMHVNFELFGPRLWVMRLPDMLSGVLIILATYCLGRMLFNHDIALVAAALTVSSWALIVASTSARGYGIQGLLVLVALILAAYLLRNENVVAWSLFAVAVALGFFTVPTMLYAFSGIFLWLFVTILLRKKNRSGQVRNLLVFSMGAAWLTSVLYSPTLARLGLSPITGNQYVRPLAHDVFVARVPDALREIWVAWNASLDFLPPALLLILLVMGALTPLRSVIHTIPVYVPLVAVSAAIVWVQQVTPYTRIWIFFLPLYLLLLSAGLVTVLWPIYKRWPRVQALTVLALLAFITEHTLTSLPQNYFNRPYEHIAEQLESDLQENDVLITYNPVMETLAYYLFHVFEDPHIYFFMENLPSPSEGRIFAVIDRWQQLDEVLERVARHELVPGAQPDLVMQDDYLSVYELSFGDLRQIP